MNTKESSKILRILIILCAVLILYIFPGFENSINLTAEKVFYQTGPSVTPDSNIVLIHISDNDIKKLGTWPLKRSYYALLIQKLDELGAEKIGIEVFLSPKQSFQSLYNNLLNEQISKSGNVVLGSVLSGLAADEKSFHCDTVFFPEPYHFSKGTVTGHLNYVYGPGITIPNIVKYDSGEEYSFSAKLSGNKNIPDQIRLRFISLWRDYKNFELVDFFTLFRNDKESLKKAVKDKIVIIGVSAESAAKFVDSPFEEHLPGIGLHAMAVDNDLNQNYLSDNNSDLVCAAFFFFLLFIQLKKNVRVRFKYYSGYILLFIVTAWILFSLAGQELNYSFVIVPLLFVSVFDSYNYIIDRQKVIRKRLDESEAVNVSLHEKEAHLAELQRELNLNPDDPPQKLINEINSLKNELDNLKSKVNDNNPVESWEKDSAVKEFAGIVYRSKKMAKVVDLVKRVAPEDATILITGESGSGKELVARALHDFSRRKDNNFIAVNCAALSETLLESEIFGHIKGAFTNAVSDKQGRFEAADKGTIFLDEIGEISENFQAKLLRVLQTGEFEKVGSSKTVKTDVRIIAATNKNLEEQVKEKKFREDLYYRLNVIKIELPPLRDRKEDISVLAGHFILKENSGLSISQSVMEQLENCDWKGNVRELESVLKHAAIFAKSDKRSIVKLCDLPEDMRKNIKLSNEEEIINSLRAKKFSHSSINETAKELGNLNRTVVSENLRGIFFKSYVKCNYDLGNAVREVAQTTDKEIIDKLSAKCGLYVNNIKKDLLKLNSNDFENAKQNIASKYKNLPQRYHVYLDSILNYLLQNR